MSLKYRLWCNVHGWVYDWADTPISLCPIENADSVDTAKVFQVGIEAPVLRIVPNLQKSNSTNYARVAAITYDPTILGTLSRVKILSSMDNGMTSYDVEVYNRTTFTSVITANFTNAGDLADNDIGLITTPPETKTIFEINVKRNGGNKKKYINVEQIVFYGRFESS